MSFDDNPPSTLILSLFLCKMQKVIIVIKVDIWLNNITVDGVLLMGVIKYGGMNDLQHSCHKRLLLMLFSIGPSLAKQNMPKERNKYPTWADLNCSCHGVSYTPHWQSSVNIVQPASCGSTSHSHWFSGMCHWLQHWDSTALFFEPLLNWINLRYWM